MKISGISGCLLNRAASRRPVEVYLAELTGPKFTNCKGYFVGGKTGTSQTIKNGKYVDNETIGTYLGFGGSESTSEYVIMVRVAGDNMNLQGNKDAMPIFTDISNWMIDYLQLQPKR